MSTEHEPQDTEAEPTPEELRADIEQTREDLGDTVEALAAKTDVKARARARAEGIKSNALAKKDELTAKVKEYAPGGDGAGAQPGDARGPSAQAKAQELSGQALSTVKQNPLPFAVAGSLVLGYLVGRAVSG